MSQIPLSVLMLTLALAGCSRKAEPDAAPSPKPSVAAASATPIKPSTPTSGQELTWTDPTEWQRVAPSRSMRKATYKIPAAPKDPEDAEMAVFYFGQGEG